MARQRGLSFEVPPSSVAASDLDGILASSWPQAVPRFKLDAPPKPNRKPSDCPVFESDVPSLELPEQTTKRNSKSSSSSRTTTASPQRVSNLCSEDGEGGVFFLEGLDDCGSPPASDGEGAEPRLWGFDDFALDADADSEEDDDGDDENAMAGPAGRGLGRPRANTQCALGASPILLTVFEQVALEAPSRARAVTSAF